MNKNNHHFSRTTKRFSLYTSTKKLLKIEFLLYLRSPMAMFFAFLLPLILIILNHLGDALKTQIFALTTFHVSTNFANQGLPAAITVGIIASSLITSSSLVSKRRSSGFYIRFLLSGYNKRQLIVSQIFVNYILSLALNILVLAFALIFFGVNASQWPLTIGLTLVLLFFLHLLLNITTNCLAIIIGSLTRHDRSAITIAVIIFLASYIVGITVPINVFPTWFATIVKNTPFFSAYNCLNFLWNGTWDIFAWFTTIVVVFWTIFLGFMAFLVFRIK